MKFDFFVLMLLISRLFIRGYSFKLLLKLEILYIFSFCGILLSLACSDPIELQLGNLLVRVSWLGQCLHIVSSVLLWLLSIEKNG